MQSIIEVRAIARPLTEVYVYLTDSRNLEEWLPGISNLKPLAGSPTVGDAVTFTVNGFSNTLTYTAVESPNKLAYEVRNAIVVLPVVIKLERIDDDTTRITKSQTIEPVGFGRILAPLLKRALRKQISVEVDLIKQHLDSSQNSVN